MSRNNLILAVIAVILLLTGAGAAWYFLRPAGEQTAVATTAPAIPGAPAATGTPGALPDPSIGIMDRGAILQYSKVGQDIMRQMQTFTNQARDRIVGQRRALENDAKQFQDQQAGMAADAKDKRVAALQQREQALQNAAAREENTLKAAIAAAHGEVAKVMGPILQQIVAERRINMVMDKSAFPATDGNTFDLTPDVIAALDAKMTTYQVSLNPTAAAAPGAAP